MNQLHANALQSDITPRAAPILQRACACGKSAGITGKCPQCTARERLGIQTKLSLSSPGDRYEQEADRIADRVVSGQGAAMAATVTPLVQRQSDEDEDQLQTKRSGAASVGSTAVGQAAAALASGGRPLSSSERSFFEPRLGRDLSSVRIHNDARSGDAARGIGARAFTLRNHIAFAQGAYNNGSTEGRRLMAHELVHTMQQGQFGARQVRRKTLTDLKEKVRKSLRFSRVAPAPTEIQKWVADYFDPKSGISTTGGTVPEFGAGITDTGLQKGLTNITAELMSLSHVKVKPATKTTPETKTQTDPDLWPLAPNSILDLELDPRAFGHDHAIYRFIHYTEGGKTKVLVERKKVLTVAATSASSNSGTSQAAVPASAAAVPSFTGMIKVGAITIKIDASFGNKRGKVIADAVALLPDPIRAKADGVRFDLAGSGNGPGGQNGQYDAVKDRIEIWDALFEPSLRRTGVATNSAYQILHEIGHALDLRPQFMAQRARSAATKSKKELKRELEGVTTKLDPDAGLFGDTPKVKAEKKRLRDEIAKVDKQIQAHNAAMKHAKSVSGGEIGTDSEDLKTAFGKALKADGVAAVKNAKKKNRQSEAKHRKAVKAAQAAAAKTGAPAVLPVPPSLQETLKGGVSNYAETDLMEAFAESFTYYVLDAATLKLVRPKTHAFFKTYFPKTASAPKTGGGTP